ncbi:unnamed protein product, partial [Prunus brigantina]
RRRKTTIDTRRSIPKSSTNAIISNSFPDNSNGKKGETTGFKTPLRSSKSTPSTSSLS